MPVISIDEAKLLADVLQTTFPQSNRPAPKRGHWLNHIARADGYRDWNAMAATAPAHPPAMKVGEWGDAFYAIAWVEIPEHEGEFYMLRSRDWEIAHPRNGWSGQLADKVSQRFPQRFQGAPFHYGRPGRPGIEDEEWWIPSGGPNPVVIATPDDTTRILLWWLKDRHTAGGNLNTPFIPHYQLCFDSAAYGLEPRTDQFLRYLTGVPRPRRTCLYRPEAPNAGPDLYVPVVVTEEEREGVLADGWQPGNWSAIGQQVYDANRKAGLSRFDMAAIGERYAYFEPREDESFEFYGMSED